jgi:acetyl-CoA C-acetyltransferase
MKRLAPVRAAVVATGQSDHGRRFDTSMGEIAREAIDRCLESRGLSFDDIDAVVAGNMEMFEGIYLVDQYLVGALGALDKPLYKLNTGGTVGASAALACYHLVASGRHRRVLGVGFQKQTEGSAQSAITTVGDPIWERAVMAGAIGNFASMASTYIAESGATPEQAAMVAVKARRNACLNPHAHLKLPDITVEQVLESEMLAYPIHRLDFCPSSDGACAIVMAAEDVAADHAEHPAWVHAVATAHDQQYMGDSPKRLAVMRSLQAAAKKAYGLAGITDPLNDFDVAEIYEPASYAELAWYENLGFCAMGDGGRLIDEGITLIDGKLPVNPSGGVLSTNPVGATAMIRVAEAAMQVMGEAGGHQIPGVRRALATGYGGNAWSDMMILSRELPRGGAEVNAG